MSSRSAVAFMTIMLFAVLIPGPALSQPLGEADVREMIERFGPVLYLHPGEKYRLANPEDILDNSKLCYGMVNKGDLSGNWDNRTGYDKFRIDHRGEIPNIAASTLINQVNNLLAKVKPEFPYNNSSDFDYWIEYSDAHISGYTLSAKALVRVLPVNVGSSELTEIQFWFYYPFNGPGHLWYRLASGIGLGEIRKTGFRGPTEEDLVRYGRHHGDWENVSLLIRNSSKELVMVAMSRHGSVAYFEPGDSDGVWRNKDKPEEKLGFEQDGHPRVYSAINSHAIYNRENDHWITKRAFSQSYVVGTVSADIVDRTKRGEKFEAWKPARYRIVKSTLPEYEVAAPDWSSFEGRWGLYEKLKENVCKLEKWVPVIGWQHLKYAYTQYGVGAGPRGPDMNEEGAFTAATMW